MKKKAEKKKGNEEAAKEQEKEKEKRLESQPRMLCSPDAGLVAVYVDESVDVYADESDSGHFRDFAKCANIHEIDVRRPT